MSSVSSELAGCINAHLGLGLRAIKYNSIAQGTLYARPIHPGAALGVAFTQHKNLGLHDVWKDAIKLFHKVNDKETTIIKHIIEAISKIIMKVFVIG